MRIDTSTDFGKRVQERLERDEIIWLTTVDRDGTPHPRPVWFLWRNDSFLIHSQPGTAKLKQIGQNPRVSLSLNSDAHGGDVVIITGTARIDDGPEAKAVPAAYLEKYARGLKELGQTPDEMIDAFRVAIHVTPEKLTGH